MEIKDKVAIITGASSGIGRATAKYLASHGAKVVLAARSEEVLNELAGEMADSLVVRTDMRKPEDIKNLIARTLEKYGRVDILINNAGQGLYNLLEKTDLNQYKQIIELNVFGPLLAMQAVIPSMREQGGGAIINISSAVSKNAFPGLGAYASTKYALNALTFTARAELEKDNIIVSAFLPRLTKTNFAKNAFGARPKYADEAPEADPPEQVAEKIAELIESGEPMADM